MASYGLIGLGSMGMGMATSMVRAGLETWAFDVSSDSMRRFAECGGKPAGSAMELAGKVDVLVLVVVSAAQVDDVLFGKGNAAAALRPGSLVIVCSTIKPDDAILFAEQLEAHDVLYLDAPMSGGAAKALQGEITMMASGSDTAFAKAEEVIRATTTKLYRMGDAPGKGSAMKIVHQLLAGVHIAAAAEGLGFGIRMGLDPQTVYDVVTNAAGNSWMFENRMAHVLAADYTPLSAVSIFVKDLDIVLDCSHKARFPAPLTAAAHQQFIQADAAGYGGEDDSAVIKVFPGISLPQ
jgi:3-hydroxyisobutyrate dehydrogenase and related beta-hydroxyacid dehydrogenases